MRYKRVSYRYALLVAPGGLQPLSGGWVAQQWAVQLAQPVWRPAADMYETETALVATLELPGVEPEDVEVLLFEDALVVEGERRISPADAPGFYHAAEIRQGRFRWDVPLACPVESELVDAHFDQGLLRISLKKRPHPNPLPEGEGIMR